MTRFHRAFLRLIGRGSFILAVLIPWALQADQGMTEREQKREMLLFLKTAMVANSNAQLYRESGSPLGNIRTGFLVKGDPTVNLRERVRVHLSTPLGGETSVLVHPSDFTVLTKTARYELHSRHTL